MFGGFQCDVFQQNVFQNVCGQQVVARRDAGRSRRRYRLKTWELPDGTLVRGNFEQVATIWRQIRAVGAEVTPRVDGKRLYLPKVVNKPKIISDVAADRKMQSGAQLIDATPLLDFPHVPWFKIADEFIVRRKRRRKAIAMLLLH